MSIQTSKRATPADPLASRSFPDEAGGHYRALLRHLDWPRNGSSRSLRTLGVTSCCREEGVSTVAAQLAATAASWGDYQVLLVDANLACPSVHEIFGVAEAPGLADCLIDDMQVAKATKPSRVADARVTNDGYLAEALQSAPVANLTVLAAGRSLGNPAWAYDSADVARIVEELGKRFDLVVFDLPVVEEASSATRVAGLLDGVLLVIEADRVDSGIARRARGTLARYNVHVLGAVLNKCRGHALL